MARKYDQAEFWDLLRHAVGLEHPSLREADMAFLVKELPAGPTVVGLVIAEPGEDIDALQRNFSTQ
jgi:hypothetical protein